MHTSRHTHKLVNKIKANKQYSQIKMLVEASRV